MDKVSNGLYNDSVMNGLCPMQEQFYCPKELCHAIKRLFLLLFVVLLCGGCSHGDSRPENYPYEPDAPAPAAHEGFFVWEHGTMHFSGDGESISIHFDTDLAALTGLPEGEHAGRYAFLSGDLPPHGSFPVRYDIVHEMEISVDGQSAAVVMGIAAEDERSGQVGVNVVTPERVPMLFQKDGIFFDIVFQKEAGANEN